jgi:hypothetical protein
MRNVLIGSTKPSQSKHLTKSQEIVYKGWLKTGKIDNKKVNNIFTVARMIDVPVTKIRSYELEQMKK